MILIRCVFCSLCEFTYTYVHALTRSIGAESLQRQRPTTVLTTQISEDRQELNVNETEQKQCDIHFIIHFHATLFDSCTYARYQSVENPHNSNAKCSTSTKILCLLFVFVLDSVHCCKHCRPLRSTPHATRIFSLQQLLFDWPLASNSRIWCRFLCLFSVFYSVDLVLSRQFHKVIVLFYCELPSGQNSENNFSFDGLKGFRIQCLRHNLLHRNRRTARSNKVHCFQRLCVCVCACMGHEFHVNRRVDLNCIVTSCLIPSTVQVSECM